MQQIGGNLFVLTNGAHFHFCFNVSLVSFCNEKFSLRRGGRVAEGARLLSE